MIEFKATLYSWHGVEIKLDADNDFVIKVVVPVWASWVTINADGEIYAFEREPTLVEGLERSSWWWADGQRKYIDCTDEQDEARVPTFIFKIEKDDKKEMTDKSQNDNHE